MGILFTIIGKEIYSQESLNVEKLDEMPDYETTNRVVDLKDTRIPSNGKYCLTHLGSLLKSKRGWGRSYGY